MVKSGRGGGRYSVVLKNLHLRIVCDPFVGINEFCETTLNCHLSGLSVILTTVIHLGSTGSILPRGGEAWGLILGGRSHL